MTKQCIIIAFNIKKSDLSVLVLHIVNVFNKIDRDYEPK